MKKRVMEERDYKALMAKAKKKNAEMSAIDSCPPEANVLILLKTAESAVECGIRTRDPNALAEGLSMLGEANRRLIFGKRQAVFSELSGYRATVARNVSKYN